MKKRTVKYKNYQLSRQRYELKRRLKFKGWRKSQNKDKLGKPQSLVKWQKDVDDSIKITAPIKFSLTENINETLNFVTSIKRLGSKGRKLHIRLAHIETIRQGAIAMLLSVVGELSEKGIRVSGDYPQNKEARKILEQSGFFNYVHGRIDEENKNTVNTILTKGKDVVDAKQSSSIVLDAMKTVWGVAYRNQALQGLLIELMANTVNHAFPDKQHRRWWLSVNHDQSNNKVSFVFVDNGVGIINTLYLKFSKKIKNLFFESDATLLASAFEGKVGSRTQLGNRGRGLPSIYKKQHQGHIRKLKVVTNNVFLDFENNTFKSLKNDFSGTYYYWEIDVNCTVWKNL
jgi:hypothetical protein